MERTVTVASARVTESESARLSAYAKLAGTKVEAIVSELTKAFIRKRVHLQEVAPLTDEDYNNFINECIPQ